MDVQTAVEVSMMGHPIAEPLGDGAWQCRCQEETMQHIRSPSNPKTRISDPGAYQKSRRTGLCAISHWDGLPCQ